MKIFCIPAFILAEEPRRFRGGMPSDIFVMPFECTLEIFIPKLVLGFGSPQTEIVPLHGARPNVTILVYFFIAFLPHPLAVHMATSRANTTDCEF